MSEWVGELIVWVSVNILVPVVVPFLLLLLPKAIAKTRPYGKGLVLKGVQDGQLFWLAVALCAVGSYELYVYLQTNVPQPAHFLACFVIVLFGGIALISVVLVLFHSLDIPRQGGEPAPRRADTGMVFTSAAFVVFAAITASVSHYLAAAATDSAILKHEMEWQAYVKCVKVHNPQLTCQQPKGLAK